MYFCYFDITKVFCALAVIFMLTYNVRGDNYNRKENMRKTLKNFSKLRIVWFPFNIVGGWSRFYSTHVLKLMMTAMIVKWTVKELCTFFPYVDINNLTFIWVNSDRFFLCIRIWQHMSNSEWILWMFSNWCYCVWYIPLMTLPVKW